jgi:hypothetical protein
MLAKARKDKPKRDAALTPRQKLVRAYIKGCERAIGRAKEKLEFGGIDTARKPGLWLAIAALHYTRKHYMKEAKTGVCQQRLF